MYRLDLFVSEPCGRSHHSPLEPVSPLTTGGVDPQVDGEAGSVGAGFERAELVRQRLGQHRDDTVGEIDRVAAPHGFAVECRAGTYVPGDVGYRHDEMPATAISRVGIRLGPHRVVEVASLAAVDGDQRDIAQISSAGQGRRPCRLGFGNCRHREFGRDVMARDGQQTYHAGVRGMSEPFDDARSRKTDFGGRRFLDDDQLAIFGAAGIALHNPVVGAVSAVDWHYVAAVGATVKDADDPAVSRAQHPDDPSFDLTGLTLDQLRSGTAADRERLGQPGLDRKSTRLNSSHGYISYAVFCLKKKKT